jgi:hypothetical protein
MSNPTDERAQLSTGIASIPGVGAETERALVECAQQWAERCRFLRRYAEHLSTCEHRDGGPCTCGLQEVLDLMDAIEGSELR